MTGSNGQTIDQIARKNRVMIIGAMTIFFLLGMCFMLFLQPKANVDIEPKIIEAKARERRALEDQNKAMQGLIEEQNKRIANLTQKDSALLENVILNGNDIRQIKINTNENIKSFDGYGSNEWTTYFAALPDPER